MSSSRLAVSVVLPVYNAEKHLRETIDSVLSQTLSNFELLLIDDGSTDNSLAIMQSYDDQRIRLLRNEANMGQTKSLIKGVNAAQGDYIAIMDADDICLSERLSSQVKYLDNRPDIDICGTWAANYGPGENVYMKPPVDDVTIKSELIFSPAFVHPTVMMRRKSLVGAGLNYNPRFKRVQDYEMWVRAADYLKYANIPEVLLLYRIHPGQQGKSASDERRSFISSILLEQSGKLGLSLSESQLSTYYGLANYEFEPSREFIERAESLMMILIEANRARSIFPEPAFTSVLTWRWFLVCRASCDLGLWVWKYFLSSPVTMTGKFPLYDKLFLLTMCLLGTGFSRKVKLLVRYVKRFH